MTKFADVVTLSRARIKDPLTAGIERFVGLEHIEPENLHISSWGDVAGGITFTNHFKPGQVLFGKRRAYQRKVAVADFEGVCSGDIYVFESKDPDKLLPELLPFICQSEGFYEYAVRTSAGSLSPRTNWKHLAQYEFPLPPIDEQRRIAELLWAADDVLVQWEKTFEKASIYFDAFTENIFQKLDKQFGSIAIGEIASVKGGKRLPKGEPYSSTATEHPYIRIVDFANKTVNETDLKYISHDVHKLIKRYIITSKDVYVSIAGTTGIVGIIPSSLDGANLTENAARLVIKKQAAHHNRFIMYYLSSRKGQWELQRQTMTTTQPKLAITRLAKIKIPNPNYDEQIEVVKILDELSKKLTTINERKDESSSLKKGMLNNLLG